jgi:MSP (Major sperm protein) domain
VAYKVKTTAPRLYVVKPNQGIMEGQQKILIEIAYIPSAVSFQKR